MWRSIWILLIGAAGVAVTGVPGWRLAFSHFVFFGDVRQDLSLKPAAAIAAGACGVAGILVGAFVFRRRREGAFAAPVVRFLQDGGRLQSLVPRITGSGGRLFGDLVLRTDHELTDRLFGGVADGVNFVEHAVDRARTRRVSLYVAVSAALVTAIVLSSALYAAGHFPRLGL